MVKVFSVYISINKKLLNVYYKEYVDVTKYDIILIAQSEYTGGDKVCLKQ